MNGKCEVAETTKSTCNLLSLLLSLGQFHPLRMNTQDRLHDNKLFAVAYSSELKVPENESAEDLLENIFETAVAKNLRLKIGGTLSYDANKRKVYQYLEGPKSKVLELLETIKADNRHVISAVHTKHQIRKRRFNSFGMIWVSVKVI